MTSSVANGQTKSLRRRSKQKSRPKENSVTYPLAKLKLWLVDNQIRMPLTVLSALGTVHSLVDQPYTAKFFSLSHYNPSSQLYQKGANDWPFVMTWVLVFTLLRATLMKYVFYPFFYHFAPHPAPRSATRFAEQAWNVFYYTLSFSAGLYIILHSPYWGDIREVWAGYPQIESNGLFKAYYLVETAFWVQQIIVLHIEARRKDHRQMLCHHLITCTLIFMSYTYNTPHVGNAILCVMDFSDILLSLAKMLKYLEYQRSCDAMFFLFLLSWPYTRHYLYNRLIYSAAFDAPRIFHRDNHSKPWYQKTPLRGGGEWKQGFSWNPEEGYYMTEEVHIVFIALLAVLQALLCLWFVMILRLAVRVVRGSHAEDDRSDYEDDDDFDESESSDVEDDVSSLSVANGNVSNSPSANGISSNGIHQRKRE